jgi:hypothetical protein
LNALSLFFTCGKEAPTRQFMRLYFRRRARELLGEPMGVGLPSLIGTVPLN